MAIEPNKKKNTKKSNEEVIIVAGKETIKPVLTQRIYVGPNLLELQKYTVMEDGFTPHIKDLIKKCPAVGKLFVAIGVMAYTESRTQERGTLEHRHYNNVIEYSNRKGDE